MPVGLLDQARLHWANYLWKLWTSGQWQAQSPDERLYGQNNLAQHLEEAGAPGRKMYALLSERWLADWIAVEKAHDGFLRDVERVWRCAEQRNDLVTQIKCALCVSSAASISANVSAKLLGRLLEYGMIEPANALEVIRRSPPGRRAELLVEAAPFLPPRSFDQALDVAGSIHQAYHEVNRDDVLKALMPGLPASAHEKALELACSIDNLEVRSHAIVDIAPRLSVGLIETALSAVQAIEIARWRVAGLVGLAQQLEPLRRNEVLETALAAVGSIEHDEEKVEALSQIASTADEDLRSRVLKGALAMAREAKHTDVDARSEADVRIGCLISVIAMLPERGRQAVIDETLNLIDVQKTDSNKYSHLRDILPVLPDSRIPRALEIACAMDDWALDSAFESIGPRLTEAQLVSALDRAHKVKKPGEKGKALAALLPFIDEAQRDAVARAAIPALRSLEQSPRRDVLADMAACASDATRKMLLREARSLRNPYSRAILIMKLARLSQGAERKRIAREAWEAVKQNRYAGYRLGLYEEILPLAPESLMSRLLKRIDKATRDEGKWSTNADKIRSVSRAMIRCSLVQTDAALAPVRALIDHRERAEGLRSLLPDVPEERRRPILEEALQAVRLIEDRQEQQALLAELSGPMDIDDAACNALLAARAGPYADDASDWGDDEQDDDDQDDDESDGSDGDEDAGGNLAPEAADAALQQLLTIADHDKRGEALRRLAPRLPPPSFLTYLDIAASMPADYLLEASLTTAVRRLPEQAWPRAFELARWIDDPDSRGEVWIAFATQGPNGMRRTAQEEGLATLVEAINEDDYPEPFLRLGYDLPTDLIGRSMELAAALEGDETPERRANVYTGLAQNFAILAREDRAAAKATWVRALRRLAERPRSDLLRDLVGFHILGRVLSGPKHVTAFCDALGDVVREVCAWNWNPANKHTA
jgi:hypothetical protein